MVYVRYDGHRRKALNLVASALGVLHHPSFPTPYVTIHHKIRVNSPEYTSCYTPATQENLRRLT
jgi:hypothetical protein